MEEFQELVSGVMSSVDEETFNSYWQPRLTETIERYLGKGNKISNCNRTQVEAISLIITDLKELINKNK